MKILEKNVRLSKSVLWQLQYDAYCQFGIEAWHKQGVPSYITSNAYTATNYARLVFAYFRDLSIDFFQNCHFKKNNVKMMPL